MTAGPVLATGQDVINDFNTGPNGGGTIEHCYSPEDFQEALDIARRDKAQYGGATQVIKDKQSECAGKITTAPPITPKDGGNMAWLIITVAVLGVAGLGALIVVGRRRSHDEQFGEDDDTTPEA